MSTGAFKDRLMCALHDSVREFNDSRDPNASVMKVALDNDFNADQTHRLVEMFNTARTLYHYKSAKDRAVAFELADATTIIPKMFEPEAAKAAAAVGGDYSGYEARERSWHDGAPVAEKAAAAEDPRAGLTLEAVSAQAMREAQVLRRTAKIAEDESRLAAETAAVALTKVARALALSFSGSDRYARLEAAFAKDNEMGPVISKLAEFVPAKDKSTEELQKKYARAHVIDDRDLGHEIALIKEAKEWMAVEAELLGAASIYEKEANDFEREFLGAMSPFFTSKEADTSLAAFLNEDLVKAAATSTTSEQEYSTTNFFGEPVKVKTKNDPSTAPSMIDKVPAAAMDIAKKPLTTMMDTAVDRAYTGPISRDNKAMSERLKNVQRQIMLQDLLTNDPILSEESPETVAQAYSAILQLAPEMASNKEIVRAALRQTVHSVAVSPYDAEVWTKLEKNLRGLSGKEEVK